MDTIIDLNNTQGYTNRKPASEKDCLALYNLSEAIRLKTLKGPVYIYCQIAYQTYTRKLFSTPILFEYGGRGTFLVAFNDVVWRVMFSSYQPYIYYTYKWVN